jgi:hypothetical protein
MQPRVGGWVGEWVGGGAWPWGAWPCAHACSPAHAGCSPAMPFPSLPCPAMDQPGSLAAGTEAGWGGRGEGRGGEGGGGGRKGEGEGGSGRPSQISPPNFSSRIPPPPPSHNCQQLFFYTEIGLKNIKNQKIARSISAIPPWGGNCTCCEKKRKKRALD